MSDATHQRAFAVHVVERLRAAGYEALWAGGCVRDELLGRVPKDYDVATSAPPDAVRDVFGRRRTLAIGAAFGVVTVIGPRAAGQIDVATFRCDAEYSDGRRPDSVQFTDAQHDAQRRDFTINGLFYDPIAERVVDYVGGVADIERHVIRAIGDPALRLREDKLRMLRAVRFAASFGFHVEEATLSAIQAMADDVVTVSAERIGMEVHRMIVDVHRAVALDLLCETKLLTHVLPEVARLNAELFAQTRRLLSQLRDPTLPTALAALLLSLHDPSAAGEAGRRLRFANKAVERTAWLLENAPTIAKAHQLPWPRLQRILTHDGVAELLALREAIAGPDDPALVLCHERLAWPAERLNPDPLIDGGDLIAHGLAPGPGFASLLEKIRDAQLDGEIRTRDEALAMVDRLR